MPEVPGAGGLGQTFTGHDGKPTPYLQLLYKSVENRNGHVMPGMEGEMHQTLDRLAEFLEYDGPA